MPINSANKICWSNAGLLLGRRWPNIVQAFGSTLLCSLGDLTVNHQAGFESHEGLMFVIEVVHIQCSKLFKGLEFVAMSMAHYKRPLKSFNKSTVLNNEHHWTQHRRRSTEFNRNNEHTQDILRQTNITEDKAFLPDNNIHEYKTDIDEQNWMPFISCPAGLCGRVWQGHTVILTWIDLTWSGNHLILAVVETWV